MERPPSVADDAAKNKSDKVEEENPFTHIGSLIRAIHTPILNVARPDASSHRTHQQRDDDSRTNIIAGPRLPVIFDLESVSGGDNSSMSSAPASPLTSGQVTPKEVVNNADGGAESMTRSTADRSHLQRNLERFNTSVVNVMDTLLLSHHHHNQHHQQHHNVHLAGSASTPKPFNFYQRIHRHHSSHSLNIPSIIVTGSGGPLLHQHPHLQKRFTFGLRRHSHTHTVVVGCVVFI